MDQVLVPVIAFILFIYIVLVSKLIIHANWIYWQANAERNITAKIAESSDFKSTKSISNTSPVNSVKNSEISQTPNSDDKTGIAMTSIKSTDKSVTTPTSIDGLNVDVTLRSNESSSTPKTNKNERSILTLQPIIRVCCMNTQV